MLILDRMPWPLSSRPSALRNVPVRKGKVTSVAPHNIRVARSGSVLNATRKQAEVNRLKSSFEYTEALRAGLSNAEALKYASNTNAWWKTRPNYHGLHHNNIAVLEEPWERHRPQLPGQFRPQEGALYNHQQANFNRRYAENHGRARKTRKSRR